MPGSTNLNETRPGRPENAIEAAAQRSGLPRRLRNILSLEDLEEAARRFLPRPIFSYISDGAERQASVHNNRAGFAEWSFVPRVLRDTRKRDLTTRLFDKTYAAPFGICPMGGSALVGFEADLAFARAAKAAHIPMILSGASLIPMEKVRQQGGDVWYQAYVNGDRGQLGGLLDRVERAGFDTIVLTVDVPVIANRENYIRNGFSLPLRPSLRVAKEVTAHPAWMIGTFLRTLIQNGMPHFENMTAVRGAPALARAGARHLGRRDGLAWPDFDWMRRQWKGKLLIKGILAASDAKLAREHGADGIIVSNHGGRQLDGAVVPLRVLPEIVAEAGAMTVMLDSGIRRGTDVLKALALGASFVFVGRPLLYASALAGQRGVEHAISLLCQEIYGDMALLGTTTIAEVSHDLMRHSAK